MFRSVLWISLLSLWVCAVLDAQVVIPIKFGAEGIEIQEVLPSKEIPSRIWIATSQGLYYLNEDDQSPRKEIVFDGYSLGAVAEVDGHLWVGGQNGAFRKVGKESIAVLTGKAAAPSLFVSRIFPCQAQSSVFLVSNQGIYRCSFDGSACPIIPDSEGMMALGIFGNAEDQDSTLLASPELGSAVPQTGLGIYSYDPQKDSFVLLNSTGDVVTQIAGKGRNLFYRAGSFDHSQFFRLDDHSVIGTATKVPSLEFRHFPSSLP